MTSINQCLKTLGCGKKSDQTLIHNDSLESVSGNATAWSHTNCSALPATFGLITLCLVVAAFYNANTSKFKPLLCASLILSLLTTLSACIPLKKNCDELRGKNHFSDAEKASHLSIRTDSFADLERVTVETPLIQTSPHEEDEITIVPLRPEDRLLLM